MTLSEKIGAEPAHAAALERAAGIREQLEMRLRKSLAETGSAPPNLRAAMEHALLAPSKRIRPVLLYMIADPGPESVDDALDLGCAVEMVHTASLILDDLPCMDDAHLRRERPTTHIAFGQATAILSAIAMLTRAFGIIAELDIPAETRTRLANVLSEAVGYNGLVAGQEIDINGRSELVGEAQIENLNWLKTGTLFVAAAEMGAILRGLPEDRIEKVRHFARHLGLAFQTADDLLDTSASAADIGKDVHKDGDKATLVSMFGAKRARMTCDQHLAEADAALAESGVARSQIDALVSRYFKARASDAR